MQKGFGLIYILIGVVIITLVAGGTYYFGKTSSKDSPKQIACTMDAKVCPDGSAVGRTGPNCEFAECLNITVSSSVNTEEWKTYTNEQYGFSFNHPNWGILESSKNPIVYLDHPDHAQGDYRQIQLYIYNDKSLGDSITRLKERKIEFKNITINIPNPISAIVFTAQIGSGEGYIYEFMVGNKLFAFDIRTVNFNLEESKPILDKIMFTFKSL